MASEEQKTQPPTGQELRPGMVTRVFDRVRQIKRAHPELSRRVDTLEAEIRDRLMSIKDAIDDFPRMERELITVLVINGIHKMCDEILIDDLEDDGQDGE
jgi:predicted transcriptional regulator